MGLDRRAVAIDPEYSGAAVWTGLRGSDVERIERNKGEASVTRFVALPQDLFAWLGYQEVWDMEGGRNPYVFRQAGLTVHIGEIGDPQKPQLMRLEWPGLRDWHRTGIGFQSPGAGHPHWQIDLFESVYRQSKSLLFDPEFSEEIESFDEVIAVPSLTERITNLTFETMHLASAAPWWSERSAEFGHHHLNAPPPNLADLSRWLGSAVAYIRQELSRCRLRR